MALIGGNGVGKTTLLRIIATLLQPTRGDGRVLGYPLSTHASVVRQHVGMMGYTPGLYEDLTASENLSFAVKMRGQRPDLAELGRVLDEVGLTRHAHARVRGFSSGMRRRLALARVLLQPPRLLLMDEPYAALDDEGVERINSVVRQVAALGGAVIAATHDLPRAREVMERVVRLDDGLLAEVEEAQTFGGGAYGQRWSPAATAEAGWR